MTTEQIQTELAALPGWEWRGAGIRRTFAFADFPAALAFVNRVGGAAEAAWHHPDIDIRWNQVTLALSTHSEGGLTANDFALARRCETLVTA